VQHVSITTPQRKSLPMHVCSSLSPATQTPYTTYDITHCCVPNCGGGLPYCCWNPPDCGSFSLLPTTVHSLAARTLMPAIGGTMPLLTHVFKGAHYVSHSANPPTPSTHIHHYHYTSGPSNSCCPSGTLLLLRLLLLVGRQLPGCPGP
jgi:hypothetical protein